MRWVVVGAGSAGCVVAARLAVQPGHDVVLVEAGGGATDASSRSASFFDAVATPGLTYPGPFLRGRGVGGSGAVNGMIATPGSDAQYRSWGWADTAAALQRVRVPLELPSDAELGPIDRALLSAAPDTQRVPLTRRDRVRVTAFDAYLGGLRGLGGATPAIRADTTVVGVAFDGHRVIGVDLADGSQIEADAVVLSAGAVGSPLLLIASGVETRGVGDGLRNHAALAVELTLRPGVAADVHSLVSATLLRRGDLQLLAVNHHGPEHPGQASLLVAAMEPTGAGRVRPGEPEPVIETVVTDDDRDRLTAGVDLVHQLLAHTAFRAIVEGVHVGTAPGGVYHATSTCRMGDVVDADGSVAGRTGLYVVDASIFPHIPAANPYLPTLMLAERMVERLLRRQPATRPSTRGGEW